MLQYNPSITGSLTITGSLIVSGNISSSGSITISGSVASASYAENANLLDNLDSTSFTTTSSFSAFSSSVVSNSASLSTRLTTDESNYTSLSSSFATTSGSVAGRVTLIEGQYATTGSNNFTGTQYVSNTSNPLTFTTTASLYTDGGLRVSKDSFVSGTAYFNNVVIYGTSSIQYITSSQVNVGANIIYLNTQTPAVRFGGMAVADSGSNAGVTGSMLWDSVNNNWIYTRESGSTYSGGALISGPRNSGSIGNEQTTLANYIMKGQGGDHITASQVYTDDNATCFYGGNASITSAGGVTVSDNLAYSTGVNSWYINTGINGAVLRLKACGSAAGYSNRSGALGWTDNGGVKADILGWDDNCITPFRPINSCCSIIAPAFVGGTISGTTAVLSSCVVATSIYTSAYSYLYGLRISGNDTGNTIYAGSSNMGITAESGYNISIGRVSDITKALNVNTTNGIVGIAVTPSNWSSGGKLEYIGNGAIVAQSDYGNYGANYYYNGGYKRIASGYSSNYYQQQGNHLFQYTTDSTGANCIFSFCEAMRITNNGSVGINTTTPYAKFHICMSSTNYADGLYIAPNSTNVGLALYYDNSSYTNSYIESRYDSANAAIRFRTRTAGTPVSNLTMFGDGTSCFGGNVCANTFTANGFFGKYYGVTCTVGSSVAIMDTGISISNNNAYLLTFTGNPAAAGGVYSWSEVGILIVNSQYNGSTLTQMITYTKSGGGGTSVYPGALTLYPYFLVGGVEYTQTTSSQPSGQIRLKICGYSNTPGTSTYAWLTQLY